MFVAEDKSNLNKSKYDGNQMVDLLTFQVETKKKALEQNAGTLITSGDVPL